MNGNRYFIAGREVQRHEAVGHWHRSTTYLSAMKRDLGMIFINADKRACPTAMAHLAEAGIRIIVDAPEPMVANPENGPARRQNLRRVITMPEVTCQSAVFELLRDLDLPIREDHVISRVTGWTETTVRNTLRKMGRSRLVVKTPDGYILRPIGTVCADAGSTARQPGEVMSDGAGTPARRPVASGAIPLVAPFHTGLHAGADAG